MSVVCRLQAVVGSLVLLAAITSAQDAPTPADDAADPPGFRSEEEWFVVFGDGVPNGRARTTTTFLADGRVATRQEQLLVLSAAPLRVTRLELLVVEDREGRVLRMDQRRADGAGTTRLSAEVAGEDLTVVGHDGRRHRAPWDARVLGPAACRRDRGARHHGISPDDAFTMWDFALDEGRARPTRWRAGARDAGLIELIAVAGPEAGPDLRLWCDAEGGVARTLLVTAAGETVRERVSREAALAAPLPLPAVTLNEARLEVGSPGLRLPSPPGYLWIDWTGTGLADLVAQAAGGDGRSLVLEGRAAPPGAPLDPATLRAALGADAVVAVERQAGGRPAMIAKDGATGTWGLAVRVGPALVVTRTDRGDDAAMEALRRLADGMRFGP